MLSVSPPNYSNKENTYKLTLRKKKHIETECLDKINGTKKWKENAHKKLITFIDTHYKKEDETYILNAITFSLNNMPTFFEIDLCKTLDIEESKIREIHKLKATGFTVNDNEIIIEYNKYKESFNINNQLFLIS